MELLIIASHCARRMCSTDPYAPRPAGLARLMSAVAIIGLVVIGLQSAAGSHSTGFGLSKTAFGGPKPLQ